MNEAIDILPLLGILCKLTVAVFLLLIILLYFFEQI